MKKKIPSRAAAFVNDRIVYVIIRILYYNNNMCSRRELSADDEFGRRTRTVLQSLSPG